MKRLLIANRGEIACRIIGSAQRLGIETVAVYSDADADALHVQMADRALHIGKAPAAQSYLSIEALLAAARESGADAVHPGYGFLSENAGFAEAVLGAGLVWVGASPTTITDMGDKQRARELAIAAGVSVLPGSTRFCGAGFAGLAEAAEDIGFPMLVKAAAGGGGIGMRRVDEAEQLFKAAEAARAAAARSFGDGTIYLEKFVERARHVEIQVFGFGDGRAVHLNERDCSLQRRFQKILEESPAPNLSREAVGRMAAMACGLAGAQKYMGAGTVEFVVDANSGEFFFLEMNTRLQVEHPVTEETTGVDLVAAQLRAAAGEDLYAELADVDPRGHAVECRLYAENPAKRFLPSPGRLKSFRLLGDHDGIRIDTGVRAGDEITPFYDPMIAKVIASGADRPQAIARMRTALSALEIDGVETNRSFLLGVLDDPEFKRGDVWTGFVDEGLERLLSSPVAR